MQDKTVGLYRGVMSVAKTGLPVPVVDDFEPCSELFFRIWNTHQPGVDSPSHPVTPEDKSRAVAAAMQAQFRSQLSRLLGERLSGEGVLRGNILERDARIEGLQKELEESRQTATALRAQLSLQGAELKSALETVKHLEAERFKKA